MRSLQGGEHQLTKLDKSFFRDKYYEYLVYVLVIIRGRRRQRAERGGGLQAQGLAAGERAGGTMRHPAHLTEEQVAQRVRQQVEASLDPGGPIMGCYKSVPTQNGCDNFIPTQNSPQSMRCGRGCASSGPAEDTPGRLCGRGGSGAGRSKAGQPSHAVTCGQLPGASTTASAWTWSPAVSRCATYTGHKLQLLEA